MAPQSPRELLCVRKRDRGRGERDVGKKDRTANRTIRPVARPPTGARLSKPTTTGLSVRQSEQQSQPPFARSTRRIPAPRLPIGIEPVRIDLLNRIAGVTFDEARCRAVRGRYGDVDVTFIGREDLVRNKLATGRARDLGDVEELR